jgi:4-amino-4-deoxy-L-arabinose transferase-like glycosyltransferase
MGFAPRVVLLAGLVLLTNWFFIARAHQPRMDLLFAAFILMAQTALFRATQGERLLPRPMAVAGLAMGMAALTKGPLGVALPLAGFALFLLRQRRGWLLDSREAGLAVAVVLALAFAYLAGVVAVEGWGFVRSVAVDQIWVRVVRSVDLSEPVYAYVPMLAAALLPWSVVLAWLIWRGVSQLGWRGLFAPSRGQPLRCPICGPAFLAVWR